MHILKKKKKKKKKGISWVISGSTNFVKIEKNIILVKCLIYFSLLLYSPKEDDMPKNTK